MRSPSAEPKTSADPDEESPEQRGLDKWDEVIDESFPASDPPPGPSA